MMPGLILVNEAAQNTMFIDQMKGLLKQACT